MNVGPAVSALSFDTVTILRPTGAYASGVWVPGAPVSSTIPAAVTPISGKDLNRLPEGRREGGGLQLFTRVLIANGDRFDWSGATYEVAHVEDWSIYGCWRGFATRRSTP